MKPKSGIFIPFPSPCAPPHLPMFAGTILRISGNVVRILVVAATQQRCMTSILVSLTMLYGIFFLLITDTIIALHLQFTLIHCPTVCRCFLSWDAAAVCGITTLCVPLGDTDVWCGTDTTHNTRSLSPTLPVLSRPSFHNLENVPVRFDTNALLFFT